MKYKNKFKYFLERSHVLFFFGYVVLFLGITIDFFLDYFETCNYVFFLNPNTLFFLLTLPLFLIWVIISLLNLFRSIKPKKKSFFWIIFIIHCIYFLNNLNVALDDAIGEVAASDWDRRRLSQFIETYKRICGSYPHYSVLATELKTTSSCEEYLAYTLNEKHDAYLEYLLQSYKVEFKTGSYRIVKNQLQGTGWCKKNQNILKRPEFKERFQ